jgi:SAM-dependent methyltransferase
MKQMNENKSVLIDSPIISTEEMLEMPRQKPRSLVISIGYKFVKIGKSLFGKDLMLRFCLKCSWLLSRFAFELSGEIYGNDFHNQAKALNEDFLKIWIPNKGSVLDIGCGVGRWCKIASKYAERVVGIDFDETLIQTAKRDFAAPNIKYLTGDVTKDLDNEKFDVALLIHVIEHIDNVDKILQELKNIASTLIVEVPDFESEALNWVRLKTKSPFFSDGDHVREYTVENLQNHLKRNGWNPIEYRKHGGAVIIVANQSAVG